MTGMFSYAASFNADISLWNVSNVTNMSEMFFGANAFNADIRGWDVSNVTDMTSMFFLASSFSQNIGVWAMTSVEHVETMLAYCGMDISTFNNVLNGWGNQPLVSGLTLGANALVYSPDGATGYGLLTSTPKNWTILGVTYAESVPVVMVPFTLVYYDSLNILIPTNVYQLYYDNAAFSSPVEFVNTSLTFENITTSVSGRLPLTLQDVTTETAVQTIDLTVNAICFKEHTKILTNLGYRAVEDLKVGDIVCTFKHGEMPIYKIGSSHIYHEASGSRNKDKLYRYSQKDYPELVEDLIVTGGHSMLVDAFPSKKEEEANLRLFKNIVFRTDDKFRFLTCVNPKCSIYEESGVHTIYHLALEHENNVANYGIYANGLLVESCAKKFLDRGL